MASSSEAFIERAVNLIHKENQARAKIFDKLQERKLDRDKLAEKIRSLLPLAYSYESRRRNFEYTEQTFLDFYSTIEAKPNEPPSVLHNQAHFMGMTSNANVERLKQKIQVITNDIRSIENHLDRINKKREKIYAQILKHHKTNI
ncbi:uncharacterized protein LOC129886966 isoform X2 [Solanum dulcamara]|uniref:uncharacterized protein LOC129886966 isoform X2 n=1 Tax=Solanum dulcamara TaxID=45834 RepID=UPI0024850678|nr:uncharacterized protein LOC129886966 isoform X2 [Solanum dulcamara]